jgi:hypothetical protein
MCPTSQRLVSPSHETLSRLVSRHTLHIGVTNSRRKKIEFEPKLERHRWNGGRYGFRSRILGERTLGSTGKRDVTCDDPVGIGELHFTFSFGFTYGAFSATRLR